MPEKPPPRQRQRAKGPKVAAEVVRIEREPWERQVGEPGAAFEAFALYRDIGYARTIRRAAEIATEDTPRNLETVYSGYKKWATRWRWAERAESYDVVVDRRMREARESEWERTLATHAQAGRALQTRSITRVLGGELNGRKIEAADPAELSLVEAARVLELGIRIERVANGKPADLLRGAMVATQAEVEGLLREIVSAWLPLIPEDAHDHAVGLLEAIMQRRR